MNRGLKRLLQELDPLAKDGLQAASSMSTGTKAQT